MKLMDIVIEEAAKYGVDVDTVLTAGRNATADVPDGNIDVPDEEVEMWRAAVNEMFVFAALATPQDVAALEAFIKRHVNRN